MASRENGREFLSQLESVRGELREKFSRAHRLLQEREAVLLQQLQEIELKYRDRDVRFDKQRKELLTSKDNLQSTMKGNENQKTLEAMLAPLDARLRELEKGRERLETIELEWDEALENKIRDVGKILMEASIPPVTPDYKNKGMPVLVACKCREDTTTPGEFISPTDIAIDSNTGNIYICDDANHRIQVFTKSCKFLFLFNERMDSPAGVAIHEYKVYVTQYDAHSLCVYSMDGQHLRSVGKQGIREVEFNNPFGIFIDGHLNLVYVCYRGNNRIQVLNIPELTFKSFITDISRPKDIQVANKEIFVLDQNNPCA